MQGPGRIPEEVNMIDEYEVRQMVEAIELSDDRPLTKARRLLRISHSLKSQIETMHFGAELIANDADHDAANRLHHTRDRMRFLMETTRIKAHRLLQQPKPMKFDTYPTIAYPN